MKKFISTLLVFTLILVFSTSAFAAKGVGDTKESAIPSQILGNLYIPDGATLYLSVERVVDTIAQYTISLHAYDV